VDAGAFDATPSLARSTAVMAAGTLVSRITGFGRVLALAYALGFHRLSDAYNVANTTPNLIYDLVLGGVLSATLIPVFVDQLARRDALEDTATADSQATRNISAFMTVAVVVLVGLTVLTVVAAPAIIHLATISNHAPSVGDQRAIGTALLRLFAPQVLLLGLITLITALLNARRRFAAPMWTPVLLNIWTIGVLVAFPHVARSLALSSVRHDTRALVLLGLGTTLGYLVQVAAMVPSLKAARIHLRPVWDPGNPTVRLTLRLSSWTLGVVAANQLAFWVILVLANAHAGEWSAYQSAYMFFQLPHAILAVSIMSALMPDLSERWTRGEVPAFRRQLGVGIRSTAAVLIPAAVGYAILAQPLVRLLLEHGRLTRHEAHMAATVLAVLAAGLPGFSIYLLLMRAYQAMKDTRRMFLLYLGENAVTVVLALALYHRFGLAGLAFAFVAPYTLFTLLAFRDLGRRLDGMDTRGTAVQIGKVAAASAVMGVVVAGAARLPAPAIVVVTVAVLAGGAVYFLAARVLGIHEMAALLRLRRTTP
jgi:putative peptidoglycan lipid II flippase